MTGLKPCPFCGGEAELRRRSDVSTQAEIVWVECKKCGAMTGLFAIGSYKIQPRAKASDEVFANVRNAWNRRVYE